MALERARPVLATDADEALERAARAYLLFVDRHRAVTYPLVIAATAGAFLLVWRSIGLTPAIVVIGFVVAYAIGIWLIATIRVRRYRRQT
jgi:hypothetical protein